MASLRSRVLASVLLLAAAGLVALGVVTYAEQRSFLLGRVDQEAIAGRDALSQLLDQEGFRPSTTGSSSETEHGSRSQGPEGPAAHGPGVSLPPGTYGQRRDSTGRVLGSKLIKYSPNEATPAAPKLPASVPLNSFFTVGSVGSSGLRYRAYARRDPEDTGVTIVAVPLREVDQTLNRLLLVEGLVIVGVLLALGAAAFFVVKVGLRPLDRMEVTAGEIAAGQLSRRVSPATPRTEVGRLGLALNAMLERLEQAFAQREASEERLRRFLADASHELRTPLASIRGYAELFRMGATRDEGETRTAIRRIEDESKRMGVLVEDLLALARLDEAPELERAPVDLATLARDAVEDAHAIAPERSIELHAPAAAIIAGDPHRLRQVLANLLRNALVHTPAGSPIEVSVAQDEDTVTVSRARSRPRPARGLVRAPVRALLARRARARARQRRRRPRAVDRRHGRRRAWWPGQREQRRGRRRAVHGRAAQAPGRAAGARARARRRLSGTPPRRSLALAKRLQTGQF